MSLTPEQLTGRSDSHVVDFAELACRAHPAAGAAMLAMREAAREVGIEIAVASAFRDIAHQATIWNRKWRGERALLDRAGAPLNYAALSETERLHAILAWSALPGASRHHWGTEFDIYDRAAIAEDYRLQLVPEEYAPHGPFAALTAWLDAHAADFGFFRPYDIDRGGLNPEPWHLSWAPLAAQLLPQLSVTLLKTCWVDLAIEGADLVNTHLPDLHERYIARVAQPTQLALAARRPDVA